MRTCAPFWRVVVMIEESPEMRIQAETILVESARASAISLTGRSDEYDAVLDRTRDARIVLIGEASHGTHEFYRDRAAITKRLIEEQGFTAVAVEADWRRVSGQPVRPRPWRGPERGAGA
jgi:erythromycin esterase-like protein